jgi:valyl-tRNA synthetase
MVKPGITGINKGEAEKVLIHVLENSLKLLHPFMPFVTDAVWQNIRERKSIMTEPWPVADKKSFVKKDVEEKVELVKKIIVGIRNVRSEMNIPHSKRLTVYIAPLKKTTAGELKEEGMAYVKNLARLEELTVDKKIKRPESSATVVLEGFNVFIPLKGVIDINIEKARLTKKIEEFERQLRFTEKRLKDKNFINKAPENIVALEKDKNSRLKEQKKRTQETLKVLN